MEQLQVKSANKDKIKDGNSEELLKNATLMKTPCQHYYHETCLKEWLRVKFECPKCRASLPPLDEDLDEDTEINLQE